MNYHHMISRAEELSGDINKIRLTKTIEVEVIMKFAPTMSTCNKRLDFLAYLSIILFL